MKAIAAALLACGALAASPVFAQQYRVLVGYPPGGVQDQSARIFAEKLREATGRPFIVETRAGNTGQIAIDTLLSAPADGATVLMTADSNVTVWPHTFKKPPYGPGDFAAIAHSGDYRLALAVGAAVPASDIKSFVAWSKTQSGGVSYGTAGAGSVLHFQGVLISQATSAPMTHVPYKGTGPAVVDLVAGHLPAVVLPLGPLVPHVKAGKIKVIAQTGAERSAILPSVPSFREIGYPTLSASGWYGLVGRAGMPAELVQRYNDILVRAMRTPELREKITRDFQLDVRYLTAEQFQQHIREDHERWSPIIRSSGFTADAN
jgi:tripartite-type tricarboxylate transporter receptor subunit TctC